MMSKSSLIAAAAGAGICFIGYCIYFDKKRRNDPAFRQKVKERRKDAARQTTSKGGPTTTTFPDPSNTEACQQYFMQEIQLGEILLSNGQIQEGVEHLANAVVVCGQPGHLMQVFAQTLPPEVVQLLSLRIPIVKQRMGDAHGDIPVPKKPEEKMQMPKLAEDDVE